MDFDLKAHPTIPKPEGPVLVCIMDGWCAAVLPGAALSCAAHVGVHALGP